MTNLPPELEALDPQLETLELDGETVAFDEGETLYEIATRAGKTIPTLCYDPRLQPFGACRLCVVDVEGVRNPVASCTARAVAGMKVTTASARVERHRKTLLELVVSENPQLHVDPLRGYASQELAELAAQYGVEGGEAARFDGAHSGDSHPDPNPFLLRDYDLCISCYRCVRVCAEQEGDYAISVANRGFDTQITTEFDNDLEHSACTFCGQCVQTCPTGALADKKALRFAPASDSESDMPRRQP